MGSLYNVSRKDEEIRMQNYLELLAAGKCRKIQYYINQISNMWRPPYYLHYCFGGKVHHQIIPTAESVSLVASIINNPSEEIQCAVANALQYSGCYAGYAVNALKIAMKSNYSKVRLTASYSIAELPENEDYVDVLIDALNDKIWTVKWNAVYCLNRINKNKEIDYESILISTKPRLNYDIIYWIRAVKSLDAISEALISVINEMITCLKEEKQRKDIFNNDILDELKNILLNVKKR